VKDIVGNLGIVGFFDKTLDWDFSALGGIVSLTKLASAVNTVIGTPIQEALIGIPNIYTFLDYFVTAKGEEYVRVWDSSFFPQHQYYLGNTRRGGRTFSWSRDQQVHWPFVFFLLKAILRVTPYYMPQLAYVESIRNRLAGGDPPYSNQIQQRANNLATVLPGVSSAPNYLTLAPAAPQAVFGEDQNNTALSTSTVRSRLPNTVLSPFANTTNHG